MIITTRWSDPIKKIKIKSKAGLVLINYSHAILDQDIHNNGGCPEAAGPDRERLLQPRKYQKYPHLRSDATSNRINHTACYIRPTMLHISCALINSSILKTSSISTNSWGPELFKTGQETSYILFRLIFHSWFIWYPLDILRAFERTTHMIISLTLKFTNTLPYAWKYHRIDSTELIQKGILTSSTQQRSTWVQYFRTKNLQVRSDSTENTLNPIQFLIYCKVQFA